MNNLVFCDCGIFFDSSQGHICINGRWIQGTMSAKNITLEEFEKELSSLPETLAFSTVEERNQPIPITTRMGNADQDYFLNASLSNLATHCDSQQAYSSQVCATAGLSSGLILGDSQQAYSEEYTNSTLNCQGIFDNDQKLTNDYNQMMGLCFSDLHASLSNFHLPTFDCQYGSNADNLSIPSDSYNKVPGFATTNPLIQQMPGNEFRTVNSLEDFQTTTNFQKDHFEMNNQINGYFGIENSGIINYPAVISDHCNLMKNEIMNNLPQNTMSLNNIEVDEMNPMFERYGENAQEMQIKGHCGYIGHMVPYRGVDPGSYALIGDIHAINTKHNTATFNIPLHNQLRLKRIHGEKSQHENISASTEYKMGLKQKSHLTSQELCVSKGISSPESGIDYSIDNVHDVAGPSHIHLNQEAEAVHSAEKSFTCNVCHKRFTLKRNLKRHMSIHFGIKPYKCEICGKWFNKKGNLSRHQLIHIEEKPFKCNICDKTFKLKDYLQQHMATHKHEKPFICEICGKGFRHKRNLQSHTITHNSEESYKCELCGRKYYYKRNLDRHKKTHKSI